MTDFPDIDLGLPGPRASRRVVCAMSGGVDSAVVAALIARAGYDVVGVTLQLYDQAAAAGRAGRTCCAGRDIGDARAVADRIGVPHFTLDYEQRFRAAVIDDFVDAYAAGETPSPCVRCNERIKFGDLLDVAAELGADALATGHYARRRDGPAGPELWAGVDPARDQSYFLFTARPDQLSRLRFPLGAMEKDATRRIAARLGLSVAAKPDSQDICFVPRGRYDRLVKTLRPEAGAAGDVVHVDGRVLGRHEGVAGFTIGQRRGLGVSDAAPLYVTAIDASNRRVIVGPRAALARSVLTLRAVNWIAPPSLDDDGGFATLARVRSTRPPAPARAFPAADGGCAVVFATPEHGVAAGQACVFYDRAEPARVLGGGWIAAAAGAAAAGPNAASPKKPWARAAVEGGDMSAEAARAPSPGPSAGAGQSAGTGPSAGAGPSAGIG